MNSYRDKENALPSSAKCKLSREYLLKSISSRKDKPKTRCLGTATCHFILILYMIFRYICIIFTCRALLNSCEISLLDFPFSPNFPSHLWGLKSLILTVLQLLQTVKGTISLPNHLTQNLFKWSRLLHQLSRPNQHLHTKTWMSQNHWKNSIRESFPPSPLLT